MTSKENICTLICNEIESKWKVPFIESSERCDEYVIYINFGRFGTSISAPKAELSPEKITKLLGEIDKAIEMTIIANFKK